jgi:hypothetical protein
MILRESVEKKAMIDKLFNAGYFKHTDGRQLWELSLYELRDLVTAYAS